MKVQLILEVIHRLTSPIPPLSPSPVSTASQSCYPHPFFPPVYLFCPFYDVVYQGMTRKQTNHVPLAEQSSKPE